MSTFLQRTLSGSLFVLIVVGALILGRYSYFVVFLGLMLYTLFEFYRLTFLARIRPQYFYGLVLGAVIFIVNYMYASGQIGEYIFLGIIPLIFSIFIIELYRNHQKPIHNIAITLLGLIYVVIPFSLLNYIVINYSSYKIDYHYNLLLGFFILLWANDSGAYIFGVSIGKNKLFPRISPKKSWEGLVGGLLVTALTAWILSLFFFEIGLFHWSVIGLICAVMGIFGDLVESMFKRSLGIKDSGKVIPGHGGLLDRFDCVLLSAPIVYVYLELMMLI